MTSDADMERRVDLDALYPRQDFESESAFVQSVMSRVHARGSVPGTSDPLVSIWQLARPFALASAAVLAALFWIAQATPAHAPPETVAEAVGVPRAFLASHREGPR